MQKLISLALLVSSLSLFAQTPSATTKDATPKEPTVAELQVQLASAEVSIATLKAQNNELTLEVQLYESAIGVTTRRGADQQALKTAQEKLAAAQKAAQDAAPKKAK